MDTSELLQFLKALKRNNKREWFHKNKDRYQDLRSDFLTFTQDIIGDLGKKLPEVRMVSAKKCTFRIARDIRFSADKRPYKNNMSAAISRSGNKGPYGHYYFHFEPGNKSMIAGGIYMPPPDILKKIRHLIDKDPYTLEEILTSKKFRTYFPRGLDPEQKLKTAPKGYAKDHPHIDLLRYKSFTVSREFTDTEVLKKDFRKEIEKGFDLLIPFVNYLNGHFTVYHS